MSVSAVAVIKLNGMSILDGVIVNSFTPIMCSIRDCMDKAKAMAEGLARENPGKNYAVVKTVGYFSAKGVAWTKVGK